MRYGWFGALVRVGEICLAPQAKLEEAGEEASRERLEGRKAGADYSRDHFNG